MPSLLGWICSPHDQFASYPPHAEARDRRRRSRAKLHSNWWDSSSSTSGNVAANFARSATIVSAGVATRVCNERVRARRARLPRCSVRFNSSALAWPERVAAVSEIPSSAAHSASACSLVRACRSAVAIARWSARQLSARCKATLPSVLFMLRRPAIPRVAREDSPQPLAPWRRQQGVHPGRGREF